MRVILAVVGQEVRGFKNMRHILILLGLILFLLVIGFHWIVSNSQAYAYLRRFTGIDFLLDCYAAEHTLSIDDVVSDLQVICQLYLSVPQIRN